jgi:flagellar basal-body rod protein FlgC
MFDALDISASGLVAQRTRMDTIAQNLANINTPRYRRRFALLASGRAGEAGKPGVQVRRIGLDASALRKVYDPSHPQHDADGFVHMPNVDMAVEMVNAIEASRAYEANVTAMEVTKSMINATLRLLA